MTAEEIVKLIEMRRDIYLRKYQQFSKEGSVMNPFHTRYDTLRGLLLEIQLNGKDVERPVEKGCPFDEPLEYGP